MLTQTAPSRKSRLTRIPPVLVPVRSNGRNGNGSGNGSASGPSARAELTPDVLAKLSQGFHSNRAYRLALNAVTQTSVEDVALNRAVVTRTDFTFSHLLDEWAVTNQKSSGRC